MPRKDDAPLLNELYRLAHEAKRQRVESLPQSIPPGWHPPMMLALPIFPADDPTLQMTRQLAERLAGRGTSPEVWRRVMKVAWMREEGASWFQIDETFGEASARELRTGGRLEPRFAEALKLVRILKKRRPPP